MKPKGKAVFDEMRAEYNFDYAKGVGGKYYKRTQEEGTNVVLLDAGGWKAFPNAEAANNALRSILRVKRTRRSSSGRATRRRAAAYCPILAVIGRHCRWPKRILHQSETRGGWRVLRKGPLLDTEGKAINATALLRALQLAVKRYAAQLETDEALWKNFRKKMNAVCANCQ
jgi:hypothetical protein